jgi:hypothetical protein
MDYMHRRHLCPNRLVKPELRVKVAARDESMKRVPQFMDDFHVDLKLAQEAIDQITRDTKDAKVDEFGVRQVELFHNSDGKVYCLLEAPDAEAVHSHHAAHGVPCGDVHEAAGLL